MFDLFQQDSSGDKEIKEDQEWYSPCCPYPSSLESADMCAIDSSKRKTLAAVLGRSGHESDKHERSGGIVCYHWEG
jgi:hypothetical protein